MTLFPPITESAIKLGYYSSTDGNYLDMTVGMIRLVPLTRSFPDVLFLKLIELLEYQVIGNHTLPACSIKFECIYSRLQ